MNFIFDTLNGPLASAALKNRGRMRAIVSSLLVDRAKAKFNDLLADRWNPEGPCLGLPISMTSWTPRLNEMPLVLVSLLEQEVRPRDILVWLTPEDLSLMDHKITGRLGECGISFRRCPNYKMHKKWIPMLQQGSTEPFVICDDDVFYPRQWLAELMSDDRKDAYVGTRCHKISRKPDGSLKPYEQWQHKTGWQASPSHEIFITGVGGAIIYPERISLEFRDWERVQKYCPQADDIWLKAAHLSADVPCYKTRFTFPCYEIPGTQSSGLLEMNVNQGGNDAQMKIVEDYFQKTSTY